MKKLFAVALFTSLCWSQQTTNGRIYDVRLTYNASPNGYTTTTGTGTASTSTITLASISSFSVGNGVFVAGACTSGCTTQASGTNYISYITAVSGNVATLHDALGSNISGAVVMHDETRAINLALATAYNTGGGQVLLSVDPTTNKCVYNVNGPMNSATNSLLTLPQNFNGSGNPVRIELVGEVRGYTSDSLSITGGCGIDSTNAPTGSGTQPSIIAVAPYVVTTAINFTTSFESVDFTIDRLGILAPNQSTLNGVMLNNALRANIGDSVWIFTKADSANTWSQPTGGTTGVKMPDWLNNVISSVGQVHIVGWNSCLSLGEHTRLGAPYLGFCNSAMTFFRSQDEIIGFVRIEVSPVMWTVDSSVSTEIPINIIADNESVTGSNWYNTGTFDLVDANSHLYGELHYKIATGAGYRIISKNGGTNIVYCDNGVAPTAGICTP